MITLIKTEMATEHHHNKGTMHNTCLKFQAGTPFEVSKFKKGVIIDKQ